MEANTLLAQTFDCNLTFRNVICSFVLSWQSPSWFFQSWRGGNGSSTSQFISRPNGILFVSKKADIHALSPGSPWIRNRRCLLEASFRKLPAKWMGRGRRSFSLRRPKNDRRISKWDFEEKKYSGDKGRSLDRALDFNFKADVLPYPTRVLCDCSERRSYLLLDVDSNPFLVKLRACLYMLAERSTNFLFSMVSIQMLSWARVCLNRVGSKR